MKINREPLQRKEREAVEDSRDIRKHLRELQDEVKGKIQLGPEVNSSPVTGEPEDYVAAYDSDGNLLGYIPLYQTLPKEVYGYLYVKEGSTPQAGIGTSYDKVTGFSATYARNCTASSLQDIVSVPAGTYACFFQASFSGTPSTEFEFTLFRDDAEQSLGCHRVIGTGGDVGSCSFLGIVTASDNTEFDVRVQADGASKSITPVDMQFVVMRIGD